MYMKNKAILFAVALIILLIIGGVFLLNQKENNLNFNKVSFSEPVPYRIDNKWGFIDPSGEITIPVKYDNVHLFVEGYAPYQQDGLWGVLNVEGDEVISSQFSHMPILSSINYSSDGVEYLLLRTGSGELSLLDKKDGSLEKLPDSVVAFYTFEAEECIDVAIVQYQTGVRKFFGAEDYTQALPLIDIYASFTSGDGLYGLMDCHGKIVVEPQYDNVTTQYIEEVRSFNIVGVHKNDDSTETFERLTDAERIPSSQILDVNGVRVEQGGQKLVNEAGDLQYSVPDSGFFNLSFKNPKYVYSSYGRSLQEVGIFSIYTQEEIDLGEGNIRLFDKDFYGYVDAYGNELFEGSFVPPAENQNTQITQSQVSNTQPQPRQDTITKNDLFEQGATITVDNFYEIWDEVESNYVIGWKKTPLDFVCDSIRYENCTYNDRGNNGPSFLIGSSEDIMEYDGGIITIGHMDVEAGTRGLVGFWEDDSGPLSLKALYGVDNGYRILDIKNSREKIQLAIVGGGGDECYHHTTIRVLEFDKSFDGEYKVLFEEEASYQCGSGETMDYEITNNTLTIQKYVYNCSEGSFWENQEQCNQDRKQGSYLEYPLGLTSRLASETVNTEEDILEKINKPFEQLEIRHGFADPNYFTVPEPYRLLYVTDLSGDLNADAILNLETEEVVFSDLELFDKNLSAPYEEDHEIVGFTEEDEVIMIYHYDHISDGDIFESSHVVKLNLLTEERSILGDTVEEIENAEYRKIIENYLYESSLH